MAAPIISVHTKIAKGNESVILCGNFTNTKQFLVWNTRYDKTEAGAVQQAIIQSMDNKNAIVTLPPAWNYDTFVMWAVNSSNEVSNAVYVNLAEIKWVQEKVRAGERAQIFGRSLAENGQPGTNNARVFYKPVAGGNAVECTVHEVNPFRIEYTVPALTTGQQYDIYVHNNHGGVYGLSKPVRVTAYAPLVYQAATPLPAREVGDVSDVERWERALVAANTAKDWRHHTFDGTLYFHRKAEVAATENVKISGANMATSRIKAATSATNSSFSGNGLFHTVFGFKNFTLQNITFDGFNKYNGQTNNTLFFRSSSTIRMIDCEIISNGLTADAPLDQNGMQLGGAQSLDISGANDCHFIRVKSTGRQMYVGTATQTIMLDCIQVQSNDTHAAVSIWGGVGFYANGCISYDLDPNGNLSNPDTFGMGRHFQGNASFGGQKDWHIEDCTGTLLTPRSGSGSDPNSGEIDMWEGNLTRGGSKAANISADGKTFTLSATNGLGSLGRAWAIIVGGTGQGQYNLVATTTASTVTVTDEWAIKPDNTSVILVGHFSYNIVAYSRYASAKDYANDPEFVCASSGFKPFGGCIESVAVANTYEGTRTGIETFVTNHQVHNYPAYEPCYWNHYENNVMSDNLIGFLNQMEFKQNNDLGNTACILGTVFRGNTIANAIKADFAYGSNADLPGGFVGMIAENNIFTGDPDLDPLRGSMQHVIFRNNTKYINAV